MILSNIVLCILKTMGIAPFYFTITNPITPMPVKDKLLKFHRSTFAFFYNISLLLISIVLFIFIVVYFATVIVAVEDAVYSVTGIVTNVLAFLTICSVWLSVAIKQKKIVAIANDLASVDINFSLLGLEAASRGNQTNSFVLFLIIGVMWMITFIIETVHWTWDIMNILVKVFMIPISFFVMGYAVILNIMENKFKILHNRFLFMIDTKFSSQCQRLVGLPYEQSKMTYFIALRRTFTTLYECGQRVERHYSFIILIVIIFLRGYFFYVCLVAIEVVFYPDERWSLIIAIGSVVDVILVPFPMTAMSISVAKFQKTMRDTNRITQKLLFHYIDDEDLIIELRIFAIESIDRKIDFMAYGFFDLDCSLILSVLDVTLTDLVIILQIAMKAMADEEEDYTD